MTNKKGWYDDPVRHSLASKGIKTKAEGRVDVGDEFYHVRQRDPDRYDKVRIPKWAQRVAQSLSKNAKVKMGKMEGSDEWEVQSVLIPKKYRSEDKADELATRIRKKIENTESKGRFDNVDIEYDPESDEYHWLVRRDSGAVFDEGEADTEVEAEILVNHHLKDLEEEEKPGAAHGAQLESFGYKLNDRAPYKNITELMEVKDMDREEANRYIEKWYPLWIDYEHPMTKEEQKDREGGYSTLGGEK